MHGCEHEADFGRMMATIERMDKEVFGNGKKGLSYTVTNLSSEVRELKNTASDLRTVVSGLAKYESQREGVEKQSVKNLKLLGVIIAFFSLIVMGIIGYFDISNKQEKVDSNIQDIRNIIYEPKFWGIISDINDINK